MSNKSFDVIIVGAGPAGCSSAKTLSDKGHKVLILEAKKHPGIKPCGGLISQKTINLLGWSGTPLFVEKKIDSIKLYSSGYRDVEWRSNKLLGVTVRRELFDEYMLESACKVGATFHGFERVCGMVENNWGIDVITNKSTYQCQYLIGADGALSTVANKMGLRPRFFYLKTGFTLSAVIEADIEKDNSTMELYFIPFLGGFGWCFPLDGAYNIGLGSSIFGKQKLLHHFNDFLMQLKSTKGLNNSTISPRACFLPAGGFNRRLGKGRVLLVGDAAGCVDPFSGEGIYNAVLSGREAAGAISRALEEGRQNILSQYKNRYDKMIFRDLRYSLSLAVMSWKKNELQFEMVKRNPDMIAWIARIMETDKCYGDLLMKNALHFPKYMFKTILKV